MKKLLLALIVVSLPLCALAATVPVETPAELPDQVVEAVTETVPAEAVQAVEIAPEDLSTLEALFSEAEPQACLDSGIRCSSASDCDSVCGSLTCECQGTCVYCP